MHNMYVYIDACMHVCIDAYVLCNGIPDSALGPFLGRAPFQLAAPVGRPWAAAKCWSSRIWAASCLYHPRFAVKGSLEGDIGPHKGQIFWAISWEYSGV